MSDEPKHQVEEPKPVETEGKDSHCVLETRIYNALKRANYFDAAGEENPVNVKSLIAGILNRPPIWLPVSQCDLNPGESFHIFRKNSTVDTYLKGVSDPQQFVNKNPAITHFLRCEGVYQIPKPPVVEKEDDGFEKWYQENPYRAAAKGKDK